MTTHPTSADRAGVATAGIAARVSVIATATALLLILAVNLLRPDLDTVWSVMSQYAVGPHGWLMSSAFAALAVSCAALAWALRRRIATRAGRIGIVLLLVAAVGLALAAAFDLRQPLHEVASLLGNLGLAVGALLIGIALRREISGARGRTLLVVSHLPWIAVVLMIGTLLMGVLAMLPGVGWANRLVFVAYGTWLIVVALEVLRPGDRRAED